MSIIKISSEQGGIWAEEATPDPKAIYIGDELNAELLEIEEELAKLELEPDEIMVSNEEKFLGIEKLKSRREAINLIIQ